MGKSTSTRVYTRVSRVYEGPRFRNLPQESSVTYLHWLSVSDVVLNNTYVMYNKENIFYCTVQ